MSVPGHTNNPNGRPKGAANKRNQEIKDYAEQEGVNPAFVLIDILSGKKDKLINKPVDHEDFKWAIDTLMPYMYAKRKPVDSDGNDDNDPIAAFIGALSGSK